MNNNDILRRLRYIFDYSDADVAAICVDAGGDVAPGQVASWLKRDEDAGFVACSDKELAGFLNGLINKLRGKKDGPQAAAEDKLTNNIIFMKLKIALNLQAGEVLEILTLVDFPMSKHELSSFFRKVGHRNFRECNDHALKMFLKGLQQKMRPKPYSGEKK